MIRFLINEKEFKLIGDNIEAISLFGSNARGDADYLSDIDLFILIDDCDEETIINQKKYFSNSLNMPISWISIYTKSSFLRMADYGSYFLWHLKTEGLVLYSRSEFMENVLYQLAEYKNAKLDLMDYRKICQDIRNSIDKDTLTLDYELSVLASLVRNTCIALSYIKGKFYFGRIQPVIFCLELYKNELNFSIIDYEDLYNFRLSHTRDIRNILSREATKKYVDRWVKSTEQLIIIALKALNERSIKND